jgi:hypothetical protein
MSTAMYHVYHLIDPRDSTVRYVGKSANPRARLKSHIQESRTRQNTKKKRWIAELLAAGMEPVMVVAASLSNESAARTRESADCHQHRATVYNIHDPAKGAKDFHTQTARQQP